MKPTYLDLKDAASLHVVHILQHPICRPTTGSTQDTMVNAPKKNLSQLLSGKYGKSTKKSTRRHHQANKCKSALEAEKIWAWGALGSLRSKNKFLAEKWRETHVLCKEEKQKCIEQLLDSDSAEARERVQDAETAIMQEQEHMRNVEKGRSTTVKPETPFQAMLNAIGDSLSDLASSTDEEVGEDEDDDEEDSELGKLSEDDEPGRVMGTIFRTVRTAWRAFGRSRWRLRNWRNQDEGTQPSTCVGEIWGSERLNRTFRRLWSSKQTPQQPHHHRQDFGSLCWFLISSRDNPLCRKWRPDSEVVKWGWVRRNLVQTIT